MARIWIIPLLNSMRPSF